MSNFHPLEAMDRGGDNTTSGGWKLNLFNLALQGLTLTLKLQCMRNVIDINILRISLTKYEGKKYHQNNIGMIFLFTFALLRLILFY